MFVFYRISPCLFSFSESYFTVKGAALILPQNDDTAFTRRVTKSQGGKWLGSEMNPHQKCCFTIRDCVNLLALCFNCTLCTYRY